MIIPDICNVLSTSGKEFSLSHWYSPIIDSWVTKIEVQRKHLFQIFRIYWIDSLFNMQVFWDLRMQWSNCPYFVAKKDLHWIYLVEKGKSGYSCQDAKFRSTPTSGFIVFVFLLSTSFFVSVFVDITSLIMKCLTGWPTQYIPSLSNTKMMNGGGKTEACIHTLKHR